MHNPFRYFNSSSEVIRLTVMMYIRYPLLLWQAEDLLFERGKTFGAAFGRKGTAKHRHLTDSGDTTSRRLGNYRLHRHRAAQGDDRRSHSMIHGAHRDPGLGSSRHPPASTTDEGWAKKELR